MASLGDVHQITVEPWLHSEMLPLMKVCVSANVSLHAISSKYADSIKSGKWNRMLDLMKNSTIFMNILHTLNFVGKLTGNFRRMQFGNSVESYSKRYKIGFCILFRIHLESQISENVYQISRSRFPAPALTQFMISFGVGHCLQIHNCLLTSKLLSITSTY